MCVSVLNFVLSQPYYSLPSSLCWVDGDAAQLLLADDILIHCNALLLMLEDDLWDSFITRLSIFIQIHLCTSISVLKTCLLLLLISSSVELVLELLLKLFGMYFVKRLTTSGDFTMDFDLQLGFTKFFIKHYCKINPKHCFVKFYGWRPKFSDLHF